MKAGDKVRVHLDGTADIVYVDGHAAVTVHDANRDYYMCVNVDDIEVLPEPVKAGDKITREIDADELAPGTVVLSLDVYVNRKSGPNVWSLTGCEYEYESGDLAYPLTVLYVPDPS